MAGAYSLGTALMPPLSAAASASLPISSSSAAMAASMTATASAASGFASMSNAPTGALGSTLEALRTLVHKRKTAWTYLKNAADGRVYWFNASPESRTPCPCDGTCH